MAILNILEFPDERLRTKARPVSRVDARIRQIIDDLFETMYAAPGIGLAATQCDIHEQILVMDISEEKNAPRCFVNPEICTKEGVEESEEGCLSVPGFFETVERAEKITVRALDRNGETFELEADGLLAVCIQHEMDHLIGKLFVDYISPLKRQMIRKKLVKAHKTGQKPARMQKKERAASNI